MADASAPPAGDFEESNEFEESQQDDAAPKAPQRNTTSDEYGGFEGEGEAPAPPKKEADQDYADGFEGEDEAPANAAAAEPAPAPNGEPAAPADTAPAAEVAPAEPAAAPAEPAAAAEAPAAEAPAALDEAKAKMEQLKARLHKDEAAPAESAPAAAEGTFSVSDATGSLHLAAKSGKVDSVQFLLRNNANPADLDTDGKTALEIAEAAGHEDVGRLLRDAMGLPPKEAAAAAPPADATMDKTQKEDAETQKVVAEAEQLLQDSPTHAVGIAPAKGEPAAESPPSPQANSQGSPPKRSGMAKSASGPAAFGGFNDMKERTSAFGAVSTSGVKKGGVYATNISHIRSSPKFTMGARDKTPSFIRTTSTPAPTAYERSEDGSSKFNNPVRNKIGKEQRWGSAMNPTKRQPGPGAYTPKDPVLAVSPKIGFGSSMRLQGAIIAQSNPGPGAYEARSCLGESQCFTAKGRHPTHYVAQKALPGPGAYTPVTTISMKHGPRAGFGTSRRDDIAPLRTLGPGPGSYELQNYKNVGMDAPKTSMTSRRRVHDINSYLTPGPGSYNNHHTCFGAPDVAAQEGQSSSSSS